MNRLFLIGSLCLLSVSAMAGMHGRRPQAATQQSQASATPELAGAGEQAIRRMLSHKAELGLTDAQDTTLCTIRAELMKNLTVLVQNLLQCQGEYQWLMDAEEPDFFVIRDKARELTTMESAITAMSVDAFDKAYAVLNEKQKVLWGIIAKKRREEMQARYLQQMQQMNGGGMSPMVP